MFINGVYVVSTKLDVLYRNNVVNFFTNNNLYVGDDYIEFMSDFGIGMYCNFIRTLSISQVMQKRMEIQDSWSRKFRWSLNGIDVDKNKVISSPIIADTDEGDQILYHPHSESNLIVLPRGDNLAYWVPSNFDGLEYWSSVNGIEHSKSNFRYFQSWIDRKTRSILSNSSLEYIQEIKQRIRYQDEFEIVYELEELNAGGQQTILFVPRIGGYIDIWVEEEDVSVTIYYDQDFEHLVDVLQKLLERPL